MIGTISEVTVVYTDKTQQTWQVKGSVSVSRLTYTRGEDQPDGFMVTVSGVIEQPQEGMELMTTDPMPVDLPDRIIRRLREEEAHEESSDSGRSGSDADRADRHRR